MSDVMKKQTRWKGRVLRPGDAVPAGIDENTKERWFRRGIAQRSSEGKTAEASSPQAEGTGYEGMKYNELRALAKKRGIALPAKTKKKVIVAALMDADAAAALDPDFHQDDEEGPEQEKTADSGKKN